MQGQILKPNTPIVISSERSIYMVIGILGILKAGAAYVPIAPNYPRERIKAIIEGTQSPFVLTQCHLREQFKQYILLDDRGYSKESSRNLSIDIEVSNLAYVIYTSGTTGVPKGVMISHDSCINLVHCVKQRLTKLTHNEKIGQVNAITFDIAMLDIALALTNGYELHVLSDKVRMDIDLLSEYIAQKELTYVDLPTVLYECFQPQHIKKCSSLRYLMVGGERLNRILDNQGLDYTFINAYGPTECTIDSTLAIYAKRLKSDEWRINNIGKPVNNTRVYILDHYLRLAPIGVVGELYIGGACLALGYLNQPKLTNERFIENPFATEKDKALGYTKLYKTGDLVRWMPDGSLEYFGRNDFQVKIRGFRIELGEIESVLSLYPEMMRCIVMMMMRCML
jgi:amino acid adenylation domain-containing protein